MMQNRNGLKNLIVLAAGGTGGHTFPADALAKELLDQGFRVALISDKRGNAHGGTLSVIESYTVTAKGIAGRGLIGRIKGLVAFAVGFFQARKFLTALRPAAVVGFGGYASAPTVAAALNLNIPTVIHEQNAVLGRANRLVAKHVHRVCTSFDLSRPAPTGSQLIRTGLPVRAAIAEVRNTPYVAPTAGEPINILILGGSQGARIFSDVIPEAIKQIPDDLKQRITFFQQCRPEELDRTHTAYDEVGAHVQLRAFFDNVPDLLRKAHLLIARSGASTVAEVSVAGRPSLLVPYPHATDGHQAANAKVLAAAGGCWQLPQPAASPEALAQLLITVLADPKAMTQTATSAASFAIPDAAGRLADVVTALIRNESSAPASKHAPTRRSITTEPMKRGAI
jgi:UDP-N-acetylglucosamine--N-acetylmuramyl-(pentapeptide) pyrophosphoryl-undecaprenol N-acetylglucosamine transferase